MKHSDNHQQIIIQTKNSVFPSLEISNRQIQEIKSILDHHNINYHISADETENPRTQTILICKETDVGILQNIFDSIN